MSRLRILHITPWYPTENDPGKAPWIKRHIEALDPHCDQYILHLLVHGYQNEYVSHVESNATHLVKGKKGMPWRILELMNKRLLKNELKRLDAVNKFDIVNFHIAYPHLVHFKSLAKWLPQRVVLTEHWSYYHYHFHSEKNLNRIKRIFDLPIKVMAVSDQLTHDIQEFSGRKIESTVVPNIVAPDIMNAPRTTRKKQLAMGSFWKEPKRPDLALEAFAAWQKQHQDWTLKVFGEGPLIENMKTRFKNPNIDWLGAMNPAAIGELLQESAAFLMPSDYETFSVVTAEALCCGCPVLVSNQGALPEHLTGQNGRAIEHGDWNNELASFLDRTWNHDLIAESACAKYNVATVAQQYLEVLENS